MKRKTLIRVLAIIGVLGLALTAIAPAFQ